MSSLFGGRDTCCGISLLGFLIAEIFKAASEVTSNYSGVCVCVCVCVHVHLCVCADWCSYKGGRVAWLINQC